MSLFKRIIFSILANAVLFWLLVHKIFEGKIIVGAKGAIMTYILFAIIFGILNVLVHPIISILTLPIRFLTLGIFSIFINGILLWMLEKTVNILDIPNISIIIDGWVTYTVAGLILAFSNSILHWFMKP